VEVFRGSSPILIMAQTTYRKIERKKFPQSVLKFTPENEYWNAFRPKYQDKLHSDVAFLRFASTDPYDLLVCSHLDVRLFRSNSFDSYKKLTFRTNPLVADIRRDTKLVAVGCKRGGLRIYTNKPARLELMKALMGHTGDVHQVSFQPTDSTKLLTMSDDKTCKYWDIITASAIHTIQGHSDFVRSGDWIKNDLSSSCFISASYDHVCKLWDLRGMKSVDTQQEDAYYVNYSDNQIQHKCETRFDHGLPIESCLSIPNSDLIAIAGGPKVTIWSLRKTNQPLTTIHLHRKSVTCLTTNQSGSRLITGCLDNHVRVFTTSITGDSIFKNSHAFSTPSGVLSLDMCANDMMLAIGTMNDGIIIRARDGHNKRLDKYLELEAYENDPIAKYDDDVREWMETRQKMKYMTQEQATGDEKFIPYGSRHWALRGQNAKLPANMSMDEVNLQPWSSSQRLQTEDLTPNTMFVRFKRKKKLKQYDAALKKFRYADALDAALKSKDTLTVHSVLEDLWRREGLEIALGGRDSKRLTPILEYLIYALPHPHLSQTSLHVAAIVIDLYHSIIGLSDDVDYLFKTMFDIVNDMVMKYKILLKLQGSIDMILSAQDIAANPLSQKMLNLSDKIQEVMQKTKLKFEMKAEQNLRPNIDSKAHDKMEMD